MECLFCKIAKGAIKTDFVYEDKDIVAFNDIKPQAAVHVVVIPRVHIERIQDIDDGQLELMGRFLSVIPKIATLRKIDKSGYRVIINCNKDAGQEIFHLHAHLLGGRKFSWPPG